MQKKITPEQHQDLLRTLKSRFEKNMHRHKDIKWDPFMEKLTSNSSKMWSVLEMESTGGEPDVVGLDKETNEYILNDCASESPKDRRSLCYDAEAWLARKENKPDSSAMEMASEMGVELLTESEYRSLQALEVLDTKTSSWIKTPPEIRKHGGAIFGDYRYGQVFIYHNGVQSYYAARGFRSSLRV